MYGFNTFRWDIQRARALREHEELLRKYRMKAGQSQEKKKEKVTTLLPTMSESKLCEKREREGERGGRGREERENGIIVFQESFVHVHCAPFQLRR